MKTQNGFSAIALCGVMLLSFSCGTQKAYKHATYANMYSEKPASVLVLPPINQTTKVEAKELFYSSLSAPISQKGFYTLPPLLAMEILKEESAYDTEMFIDNSMKKVGELFGVDAVLFTIIKKWDKVSIAGYIQVSIEYILKSTKTDEKLFHRSGTVTFNPSSTSNNLLIDLIANSISAALTKEISVAEACNNHIFLDMPAGRYDTKYHISDSTDLSAPAEFNIRL